MSTTRCWLPLLALGVALGCDAEASLDTLPEQSLSTAPAPVESTPAATPDTQLTEAPDPALTEPEASVPVEETAAYKPPYPDRVDLFAAPERKGNASKNQDESVSLVGFAKRDETKALLSFNGQVSPVAEGAERNGVQVISIQPPNVVLQRGRQRWQASIEN